MLNLIPFSAAAISLLIVASMAPGQEPAAETAPPAAVAYAPLDLSGCWSGNWRSERDGHEGPIDGRFTKLDDNHYCVEFRGRFWKLFPFKYTVVLTVTERTDGLVRMSGSSDLGRLFGTFWYEAVATDTHFVANYCSKRDHGVFSMCRCCRSAN
jgi:hypothetical protein